MQISPSIRRLAHAIPLLTLPSGLWRIALVAGVPVMAEGPIPPAECLYIVALSVVAEALAYLCVGLVRPWSEVVPRWTPVIGGRVVPRLAVTVPAASGAAALTMIWTYGIGSAFNDGFFDAFPNPAQKALVAVCYLPLLAWGPILGILTVDYHRRRLAFGSAYSRGLR
jgi:hypothetical protein